MINKNRCLFSLHKSLGLLLFVLTLCSFTFPIITEARQDGGQIYALDSTPNENNLDSRKHYVNKDGKTVHSPAKSKTGNIPDGASAQCRDGSYSFSRHHSGTCSHHGGVQKWLQ